MRNEKKRKKIIHSEIQVQVVAEKGANKRKQQINVSMSQ